MLFFRENAKHEISVIDIRDDGLKAFLSLFHLNFPISISNEQINIWPRD
jgi:hypothetical protein